MEDFRLRVFVTAAQTLNFSHCAQLLGISQPAVSSHIKEMEKHYGVALFDRKQTGLELTPYGKAIYLSAEDILSRYSDMEQQIRFMSASLSIEHFTLAISYASEPDILRPVISQYKRLTGKDLQVRVGTASDIEQWLLEGSADLAFMEKRTESEGLKILDLKQRNHNCFYATTSCNCDSEFHKIFAGLIYNMAENIQKDFRI